MTRLEKLLLKRRPRTIGDLCRYIEEANTALPDGFVAIRTHNPDLPKQFNKLIKEEGNG
jgi:hypothetical protein